MTADFKASLGGVTMQMLNDKLEQLGLKRTNLVLIPDAASWATKLEELLAAHNVDTTCVAFIIDGDMAKNWKTLFSNWRKEKEVSRRERSVSVYQSSTSPQVTDFPQGTELFMADNLLSDELKDYIQSPADDIESFFWVTLYAILRNVDCVQQDRDLGDKFELGFRSEALISYNKRVLYPEPVMNLLMRKWHQKIMDFGGMYLGFAQVCSAISGEKGWLSEEEEAKYWEAAWHGYALQGVCESLECIFAYIDS